MELDAFLTYLGESPATGELVGELTNVLCDRGLLAVVPAQVCGARPAAALVGSAA